MIISVTQTMGQWSNSFAITRYQDIGGINSKCITDIYQARNGFLWFTTAQGLVRFDATNFRAYNQKYGYSNSMTGLTEESNGNLWVSLADGSLAYFNPNDGLFKNLAIKIIGNNKPVSIGAILKIHFDKHNRLWAATSRGLIQINQLTGEAKSFRIKDILENDSTPIIQQRNTKVSDIYEDEKGLLWLATDDGLYCYNPSLNKMSRIGPKKVRLGEWPDYAYQRICRMGNCLYLASWGGGLSIYCFTTNKFEIYKFNLKSPKSGTNNIIRDIITYDTNNLLIASPDSGLASFNSNSNQFRFFRKEKDNTNIQQFLWNRLVKDKDGNIWAHNADGLAKIITTDYPFQYKTFPVTHSDNHIFYELNDMWENDNYRFVSLSFADGVHLFNKKSGQRKILSVDFFNADEQVQYAEQIFNDSKNNIWIVTSDYIYQFDNASQKLKKITQPPTFSPQHISNFFLGIAEDKSGNIWLNTARNGVFIFDPKTEKYRHFIPFTTVINGVKEIAPIISICADKKRRIWLGSKRGFIGYSDGLSENITEIKNNETSSKISDLFADSKGCVWASTDKGLLKFNAKENNPTLLRKFTTADGFSSDLLTGLCEDGEGSIWCISDATMKVFKISEKNNQVVAFDSRDGINEPGALIKMVHLKNDSVYLLCQGGIYSFCPSVITNRKPSPNLVVSTMSVNGKEKNFEEELKNNSELILNPNENSFYFEFAAIDFKHPEDYFYAYKLVGYDDKWNDIGNRNAVSFTNLKGGHYKLFIKASSRKGIWNVNEIAIPFYILTPFYFQRWFILLCIISISVLIYFYIRIRFSRQRKIFELENKTHNLEKEKAKMQYESLKQHLNPHFLFNSLTSLGSLIRFDPKAAITFLDGMSKIYRYILQSKDEETVLLKDEITFVQNFVALQTTRFGKGLQVVFEIEERYLNNRIVPVTLQNMIENAIKHNMIEEESPLKIMIKTENQYLIISNNLQKKMFVETSNRHGLNNMITLYAYLSKNPMLVLETTDYFTVKIPLI